VRAMYVGIRVSLPEEGGDRLSSCHVDTTRPNASEGMGVQMRYNSWLYSEQWGVGIARFLTVVRAYPAAGKADPRTRMFCLFFLCSGIVTQGLDV